MESVEELCDHIALINKSEKILEGKLSEIRNAYRSNQVDSSHTANFRQLSGMTA